MNNIFLHPSTWALIYALTCTPSIGLAKDDNGQSPTSRPPLPQKVSTSTIDAQQTSVVAIGGSTGIGISYLPLIIMKEKKLLEKHAASLGIDVTMRWERFPAASAMYDALLSGKLAFASGGVTQLLTSRYRTGANVEVKGVGALNAMPLSLVTSNPDVRSITDFTSKDRIALPAVRTSIQAVVLNMAAEKAFGLGQANKLDPITASLGHPEAMKDVLEHKADVDSHFSSAPFMYEELARPGIHKVLDSYKVLGGPHTYNAVWTTTSFHDAHPKIVAAFVDALQEALDGIKADPAAAAALWLKAEDVKNMSQAQVEQIIRKPEIEWTTTPKKFMAFAAFMHRTGLITAKPNDWHELFFENVHEGD